jgi:hypothetical protein
MPVNDVMPVKRMRITGKAPDFYDSKKLLYQDKAADW